MDWQNIKMEAYLASRKVTAMAMEQRYAYVYEQAIRNRKNRSSPSVAKMDASLIAKMYASKSDNFQPLGQFWMIPVIAKMDALKVNIVKIPTYYP